MTAITQNISVFSGIAYDVVGSDQHVKVEGGVQVNSVEGTGIFSSYSETDLVIAGVVAGGVSGIEFNTPAANSDITVLSTGTLDGSEGVLSGGDNFYLNNLGSMTGADVIVASLGNDAKIINRNEISASGIGVYLEGGVGAVVENYGDLSGDVEAIKIDGGSGATIINKGRLSSSDEGNGMVSVLSLVGDVTLVNQGVVAGAVELASNSTVKNSGDIMGDVMHGGVSFTTGRNTYYGRGGTVERAVIGGAHTDILIAGDGPTTLAGGAGHDRLYAGTGADTFAMSSYATNDTDNIHGFKTATDTIELDSSVFTALAIGQTPELTIGTQPSDSTDHLVYNPASGGLFYVPTGSQQLDLVATLVGSPTLTAANITVVNKLNFP